MVSVIIPAYNRAHTIKAAVESVLSQTWSDLELILVDDGSTDETKAVIESIKDERIRYIYQPNAGACAARNNGIGLAMGEYIAFHDSDDIWHADKLELQMKAIEESGADIVFCKIKKFKPDGSFTLIPTACPEGFLDPIENLFGIGTQSIIAKREVFDEFRFDPEMPRFQEFEMLYRATKKHSIYCVDKGLVDYYIGEDSISSNPQKVYSACSLLRQKHPELVGSYPKMASVMAYSLLNGARLQKNKADRKKFISLAKECRSDIKIAAKSALIYLGILK
ncbi:MAG: glycosyltransferase family 2 protein [Clostridia bacterium]|nr:glycosyltransferase family 2 protein [Clostridia bacterium]